MARAIEAKLGPGTASALDAATIQIMDNGTQSIPVLIADISELPVEQSTVAKVIVNERTGTVVIGSQVQVSPVAISHGNLTIEVSTDYQVSQPSPISETGDTVIVPDKAVTAEEERPHLIHMDPGVTLDELVRALNELKVTPRDMVAILQALKQAGALHAELEII